MQRLNDEAIQSGGLIPDLGKAAPSFRGGDAEVSCMTVGSGMAKGAGAMPEDEMQVRVFRQYRSQLCSKRIQLFQASGVGASLVSDERSAKLEENEAHTKNVARSDANVKKV